MAREDDAGPFEPAARAGIFASLRLRDFRLLWLGQVSHTGALWAEQIAGPVLVYELTGSAAHLGAVVAMRTLPQLALGVVAGVIFVFMPVAGTFIVPQLVGGTSSLMIGNVISSQFGGASNWALGSALAIILLIVLLGTLSVLAWVRRRTAGAFH